MMGVEKLVDFLSTETFFCEIWELSVAGVEDVQEVVEILAGFRAGLAVLPVCKPELSRA